MTEEKRQLCDSTNEALLKFFSGLYYPPVMAVIIFLGHLLSIEVFTFIPVALLTAVGMIVANSIKPLMIFAVAFLFQMAKEHSPGYQSGFSDYYFTEWRLPLVIIAFCFVAVGMGVYFIRNRLYRGISFGKIPLLAPALALSAAFLLNGAFSDGWSAANPGFGGCQVLMYLFLFLFLYQALRHESAEDTAAYFAYVSAVTAMLLVSEVALVYLRCYIDSGSLPAKEEIVFGWGIWNTAGVSLTVLIPMCFLGVIKSRRFSWLYFAAAALTLAGAALTQSRNALLVGLLIFAVCAVSCCFVSRYKNTFTILCAGGVMCLLIANVIFEDKLAELLPLLFADNGRFELWQIGIDNFRDAPIFGKGFYSFTSETFVSTAFLPDMAHCTPIEILSAMGIFGILAYGVYRVFSLLPLFRRPNSTKLMLALSMLALLIGGLVDNFVFYFMTVIHYSFALALLQCCGADDRQSERT